MNYKVVVLDTIAYNTRSLDNVPLAATKNNEIKL